MDNNNLRPPAALVPDLSLSTVADWMHLFSPHTREIVLNTISDFPPDSQLKILSSTMETLINHPFYGHFAQEETKESDSSMSQDYLRKIFSDVLTVYSNPQTASPDSLRPKPSDWSIQLPAPKAFQQIQPVFKPKSQAPLNIMNNKGYQSFSRLRELQYSGLSHTSIPVVDGQNPNLRDISVLQQSSERDSAGQGVTSNMFANPQRQIPGTQEVVPHVATQQKLLHPTFVQYNMPQQQENLLQPTSRQSSVQTSSVMLPSFEPMNLCSLEPNQPSYAQQSGESMQQHPQSVLMQQKRAENIHQQQPPTMQESTFHTHQEELMPQENDTFMLQNQITEQQNIVGDLQELIAQRNYLSSMHQQQLGSQINVAGLQQKQEIGGNSTMQTDQQSLHMLQHPEVLLQLQTQQNALNTLPTEGKQAQEQLLQLQSMAQMQSQPTQSQKQLDLQQQQPIELQQEIQSGLQALTQGPDSLLHQQKLLHQSQSPPPEMSSGIWSLYSTPLTGHSNEGDEQEEVQHKANLLEEIHNINSELIDTVVEVSEDVDAAAEEGVGTIVKCSYIPVALSAAFKSHYASGKMSRIQPLRLLVPTNYPDSSPKLLEKLPVEVSKEDEDLSKEAKLRLGYSLRMLSEPMSLTDIARTWDACTRQVIIEYAQKRGGGTFSTVYGSWQTT